MQQVLVDHCFSSPCKTSWGSERVPQDSVLDPTLFLLCINDIPEGVHNHIKLFADDCLIYRTIQSPSDQYILQQDLNTLVKWEKLHTKFNTKVWNYGIDKTPQWSTPLVTIEQHIWVHLHHRLSWKPYAYRIYLQQDKRNPWLSPEKSVAIPYIPLTISIYTLSYIGRGLGPYSGNIWQGKFGKFGKSLAICQTKIILISSYN